MAMIVARCFQLLRCVEKTRLGDHFGAAKLAWNLGGEFRATGKRLPVMSALNGIAQLYLDGRKLGKPIDFYHEGVIPTGEISLGVQSLTKGDHTLSVEIIGANEQAIKAYMFGLDYVRLVKAK